MAKFHDKDPMRGQIVVHKSGTQQRLIEFLDQLKLAPPKDYAGIHAGLLCPTIDPNGRRIYSTIGVVIQEFGVGGKGSSIRVKANISPDDAAYLWNAAKGAQTLPPVGFEFSSLKILGEPDCQGFCYTTSFEVSWVGKTHPDLPWKITIGNGRGRKGYDPAGVIHCLPGTFTPDKRLEILLSRPEFFRLTHRVGRFIELWEFSNCLIHEGRQLVENNRKLQSEVKS